MPKSPGMERWKVSTVTGALYLLHTRTCTPFTSGILRYLPAFHSSKSLHWLNPSVNRHPSGTPSPNLHHSRSDDWKLLTYLDYVLTSQQEFCSYGLWVEQKLLGKKKRQSFCKKEVTSLKQELDDLVDFWWNLWTVALLKERIIRCRRRWRM